MNLICAKCETPLSGNRDTFGKPQGAIYCFSCWMEVSYEDEWVINGTTSTVCPECDGGKREECVTCCGTGNCTCCDCESVHECRKCEGTGMRDCSACKGTGRVEKVVM